MLTRPAGSSGSRHRRALARTAVAAVAAGLPVVPGAWWSEPDRGFVCDRRGCARRGLHPIPGLFSDRAGANVGLLASALRDPREVVQRWRHRPYAVLVPTGETCDVVDVPTRLGRVLLARTDGTGPVIAAGPRWFFLTTSGGELPGLGGDVLVHGLGSWIMLPPSQGPGGQSATWVVRPNVTRPNVVRPNVVRPNGAGGRDWGLPSRDQVILALTSAAVPRLQFAVPV